MNSATTTGGNSASGYQLLEARGRENALVVRFCLPVFHSNLVHYCENRVLDKTGEWPDEQVLHLFLSSELPTTKSLVKCVHSNTFIGSPLILPLSIKKKLGLE